MKTPVETHHCKVCGLKWERNHKGDIFIDTLHPGMNPTCPEHFQEIADLLNPKPKRKPRAKKDD